MRQHKYSTFFEATAHCPVGSTGPQFFSLASLSDLKEFLPDAEKNPDLLAIASNVCVVNIANKRRDLIDTKTALKCFGRFKHKFLNVEHDRSKVIGHISAATLTKYSPEYKEGKGSEIIGRDGIEGFEPFNIAVAGYIYRYVAPKIVKTLENANDPKDGDYLSVSLSWEIGFDKFVLMAGSPNRADEVELIEDEKLIEAYAQAWRDGKPMTKLEDGREVYRLIVEADGDPDSVIPLGAGLTMSPAANVAGIVTHRFESEADKAVAVTEDVQSNVVSEIPKDNLVQTEISCVKANRMKVITSLSELLAVNDENAKDFSFAGIANVVEASVQARIQEAVEQANRAWSDKATKEQAEAAALREQAAQASAKVSDLARELNEANEKIARIEQAQQTALASEDFNRRMEFLHSKFELNDKMRAVIASRIKGLSEDDFNAYVSNELEVWASAAPQKPAAPATVIQEVIANVPASTDSVPNTPSFEQTFKEKHSATINLSTVKVTYSK